MAITATGLGSGMDVSGLVKQLVDAERAGSDLQISRETSKLNSKLSALGSLKGSISSLQGSLAGLNSLDTFGRKTVTSSTNSVLTATADKTAVPNTYNIDVTSLAEAHALASRAFADADTAVVGTGTLTFRFGTTTYDADTDAYGGFALKDDSKITTLTIDSSNNTLTGIMEAINDADFGVSASIVNDGTGFRLLISSDKTGLESSMEISVQDSDGNHADTGASAGLSNFVFNASATNMDQTHAAANAVMKINGLMVQSQENTTSKAIPGVTLNLKDVSEDPVKVTVAEDTTAVVNAFNAFITSYNQFRTTVNGLTSYNAETRAAGPLLGDFTVRAVISQVENILRKEVEGIGGETTTLADLGLKTTATNGYTLDTEQFKKVLLEEPETVKRLFAALGVPSDGDVSYQNSTADTKAGSYAVNITTAATSGSYAGSGVLPDFGGGGTLVIDGDNDGMTLTVDGIEDIAITLTAGTYTSGESLASELQARINGADKMAAAGRKVTVTYDAANDRFEIESTTFGSSSRIDITAVDANTAAALGLSVAHGTVGVDVEGTIGGKSATGAGQLLTSTAEIDNDAKGLSLMVAGSATGARGSVNFTRGVSDQLNVLLKKVLDDEGALEGRIDNIQDRKKVVDERKANLEIKWKAVQDRYTRQFNSLDAMLMQLQSTSSYLQTQLANLPGVVRKQN